MTTYVITFESTECAMDASDALQSAHLHFRTLPTPQAISAGCGIALRIDGDERLLRQAAEIIAATECGDHGDSRPLFSLYEKSDEDYRRCDTPDAKPTGNAKQSSKIKYKTK